MNDIRGIRGQRWDLLYDKPYVVFSPSVWRGSGWGFRMAGYTCFLMMIICHNLDSWHMLRSCRGSDGSDFYYWLFAGQTRLPGASSLKEEIVSEHRWSLCTMQRCSLYLLPLPDMWWKMWILSSWTRAPGERPVGSRVDRTKASHAVRNGKLEVGSASPGSVEPGGPSHNF